MAFTELMQLDFALQQKISFEGEIKEEEKEGDKSERVRVEREFVTCLAACESLFAFASRRASRSACLSLRNASHKACLSSFTTWLACFGACAGAGADAGAGTTDAGTVCGVTRRTACAGADVG